MIRSSVHLGKQGVDKQIFQILSHEKHANKKKWLMHKSKSSTLRRFTNSLHRARADFRNSTYGSPTEAPQLFHTAKTWSLKLKNELNKIAVNFWREKEIDFSFHYEK